jgi:hypothetical protein
MVKKHSLIGIKGRSAIDTSSPSSNIGNMLRNNHAPLLQGAIPSFDPLEVLAKVTWLSSRRKPESRTD